ncbi:bifunctional tRNA (5-methylaminomethyl-2-thiouridine)(34)-methyltransferase MnmD/FAD-dependent 5-carboxymethylaminomethyl-2-thiouridine(34) oxidoreductase MnmC [Thaumasiovibrio sp. DFM-14]|uniref:bifunctional tRNA (5-methylaminomethyl-2-thiouridine)(34)-methyltransferase MnmD/FAD-dependent 5-carboxymethylaminomethyl-2-thiouridine(34) oxidoreductase MnmC n=1 Tax=Thaumasiovibrio sp. DFM-14 TaxID=3384792 RepID=UPI0039A19837
MAHSDSQSRTPLSRITHATLDWNDAGTPVSDAFDDVYFSNQNGLEETRYVFLKQNHLPERWLSFDEKRFVIAETGFGTGLNFLAVWQWFKQFRQANPDAKLQQLHFISFEKFPVTLDDLKQAHQSWPELAELAAELQAHYPPAIADCHRLVLEDGLITLDLWFGDIQDCLPQVWTGEHGIVDCWFLDGFAPSKNEAMWSQDVFNAMVRLARVGCTTATFTAAGFVRRGLIEAGFEMKKVKGFGTKRDMLAGHVPTRCASASYQPWYATEPEQPIPANRNIAVIGGGIAAATTVAALARRGENVTLFCQDEALAQGASGNRQGAVYPLLNNQFDATSRFFSTGFIYARQLADQVNQTQPFAHDWCGVTQLRYNDEAEAKLTRLLDGQFDPQLVQGFTPEEANRQLGLDVDVAAIHYPLGGWVCPEQMTQSMLYYAQHMSAHVLIKTSTHVQQLVQTAQGWQLTVNDDVEETLFSHVVIATGHNIEQFAQTRALPAFPVRGQVSHIPSNATLNQLNTVLCYDGYLTPANDGMHCLGASYARNDDSLHFDERQQEENLQRLSRSLPQATWLDSVDIKAQQARVGIRSATRDHLPFCGPVCDVETLKTTYAELHKQVGHADTAPRVPLYSGLYCMLGLGSRGLSSAPLLGEVIASQICGDPLPLPQTVLDALHPGRMWVRKLLKGKAI